VFSPLLGFLLLGCLCAPLRCRDRSNRPNFGTDVGFYLLWFMSDWLASPLAERDVCRRRTTSTTLRNKGASNGTGSQQAISPSPLRRKERINLDFFSSPTRLQRTVFRLRRHFGDPSSQQPEFLFSFSAFLRFYLSAAFFCWLLGTSERIHLYFFYRWKTHLTQTGNRRGKGSRKSVKRGKQTLKKVFDTTGWRDLFYSSLPSNHHTSLARDKLTHFLCRTIGSGTTGGGWLYCW